jgi:hypothetical protein
MTPKNCAKHKHDRGVFRWMAGRELLSLDRQQELYQPGDEEGLVPTVDAFVAIAKAAGVSPAWLLQGDDQTTLASSDRLQAMERRLQNVEMPLARQIAEVDAKIDSLAAQVAKLLQRLSPKP